MRESIRFNDPRERNRRNCQGNFPDSPPYHVHRLRQLLPVDQVDRLARRPKTSGQSSRSPGVLPGVVSGQSRMGRRPKAPSIDLSALTQVHQLTEGEYLSSPSTRFANDRQDPGPAEFPGQLLTMGLLARSSSAIRSPRANGMSSRKDIPFGLYRPPRPSAHPKG